MSGCASDGPRTEVLHDIYYVKRSHKHDVYQSWASAAIRWHDLKLITHTERCKICPPSEEKCECNKDGERNYLFNLTADPTESVNLLNDESYGLMLEAIYERLDYHYEHTLADPRYRPADETPATLAFISNSGFVTEWTAAQLDADTILPKPNISNISWVDYGVDDDGSSNATTHSKHSGGSTQRAWRSQNDDEMTE